MSDASVDAIVTDPPYELSNDGKQSPSRVFLEFTFPKHPKIEAHCAGGSELAFLVREILGLGSIGRIPRPSAAVPVVPMTFDDDAALGQQHVEYCAEGSIGVPGAGAGGDIKTQEAQHLGCFALKLADPAKLLKILNEVGAGFLSGGLGIGFISGAARLPSLLHGLGAVVSLDDHVGALNYALADLVRAGSGAAGGAMLRFDLAGGSVEQLSAASALLLTAILEAGGAQLVRADAAASSLPSMFQSRRICVVDGAADRALSFDLIVHTQSVASVGFMGKAWDGSKIAYNVDMWREALRVLKPGGHLLAFSGSRTYHRMTCAIEDAGFEIRDQIMWVYGSGFPKSLDVSKAIDKAAGAERAGTGTMVRAGCRAARGGDELVGSQSVEEAKWKEVTLPTTDDARQWEGWGTALKPAHEPICVARKPLVGTVAANVLAHGTGALNIDGCRVGWPDGVAPEIGTPGWGGPAKKLTAMPGQDGATVERAQPSQLGRWPANLIHDGSDEVVALFPNQQSGSRAAGVRTGMGFHGAEGDGGPAIAGSSGSAARFFYCAKASRKDRNEGIGGSDEKAVGTGATMREREDADWKARNGNHHPTVKPTDLMAYLVRLVTPPSGTVLDPFMGSGSTGKAAMREGFRFVGIDLTPEYVTIATARIEHELARVTAAKAMPPPVPQMDLFAAPPEPLSHALSGAEIDNNAEKETA